MNKDFKQIEQPKMNTDDKKQQDQPKTADK